MPIDLTRYPPNWDKISKRIKTRDKHTCQHCGAKSTEHGYHDQDKKWHPVDLEDNCLLEAFKEGQQIFNLKRAVMTVAHLDHDETNWEVEDDRLLTLCASCHLVYDCEEKRHRHREKKYRISLFPYVRKTISSQN